MIPTNGQINMYSRFGQILALYGSDPCYKTFLEVGTWNGQGSTACIINGILNRSNKDREGVVLYSIENDPQKYQEAKEFWSRFPEAEPHLSLLFGRISDTPMKPLETYKDNPLLDYHSIVGYEVEKRQFENSSNIRGFLGSPIDVVLLDGGDYCTEIEFEELFKGDDVKVFALDDTNVYKCFNIVRRLEGNKRWLKVHGDEHDRNGYQVYQKIEG